MKRVLIAVVLSSLIGLLGACTTGTSETTPPTGGSTGPLTLLLAAVSPAAGLAPMNATFTASISGGEAPFDYAWDFENDGAFDGFVTDNFNRTVTRTHVYHLRAEDAAAGISTYQAILRVRDNRGVERISDPMTVVVTNAQTLIIDPDPNRTFVFSDEQDANGDYLFRSGRPVYFRLAVMGGAAPYSYQWDFNNDGSVDSTVPNPQYIYTHDDIGFRTFLAQVTVVDSLGERASFSFPVSVEGRPLPPGAIQEFVINFTSNPPATGNTITLRFDPSAAPGDPLPTSPQLEMSAGVSQLPDQRGVPPYEFYWDFENDNRIDALSSSVVIPYYDSQRRITVNPYLHNEDERTFVMRLLVIDSAGQRRTLLRNVRVINMDSRPADNLNVDLDYGPVGTVNQPFAQVSNSAESLEIQFRMDISGSSGFYEYQIDIDGNGTVDIPEGGGWAEVENDSEIASVMFGPYDHDDNPDTDPVSVRPVPQFYPAVVTVRSLESEGGPQADRLVLRAPLSIVMTGPGGGGNGLVDEAALPGLPALADHVMVGFGEIVPGGANGQFLQQRGAIIAGGVKSPGIQKNVYRINEGFAGPAEPGARETRDTLSFVELQPLLQPRRGAFGGLMTAPNDPNTTPNALFYVMGGRLSASNTLASLEFQRFSFTSATEAWIASSEDIGGSTYKLYDSDAAVRTNTSLWFTGGLNRQEPGSNANTSGATFSFNPGTPSPEDDSFAGAAGLRIPRYELQTVIVGNHMYAIGGRVATGQSVSTMERLDLGGGPWTEVAPMLSSRAGHSAEVILHPVGGQLVPVIYVYGGADFGAQGNTKTLLSTAEVYNPATDSWSRTVPLRGGRATYDGAAVRLPARGGSMGTDLADRHFNSVWYFGGEDSTGAERNWLQEFVYFYTVSP